MKVSKCGRCSKNFCSGRTKYSLNSDLCPDFQSVFHKASEAMAKCSQTFGGIQFGKSFLRNAVREAASMQEAMARVQSLIPARTDPGRPEVIPTGYPTLNFDRTDPGLPETVYTVRPTPKFNIDRAVVNPTPIDTAVWQHIAPYKEKTIMTEKEALDISIEMWTWLAETGLRKEDLPERINYKVKGIINKCTLCDFYVHCEGCPLTTCGEPSLYTMWKYSYSPSKDKKSKAKTILLQIVQLRESKYGPVGQEAKSKKERIKELEKEIVDLKEEIKAESKEGQLYLELSSSKYLHIRFNGELLGYIAANGQCKLLSLYNWLETYKKWREAGMKVNTDIVRWRGKDYQLTYYHTLECVSLPVTSGKDTRGIYDFENCIATANCSDDNIIRFEHNNRPVIF